MKRGGQAACAFTCCASIHRYVVFINVSSRQYVFNVKLVRDINEEAALEH